MNEKPTRVLFDAEERRVRLSRLLLVALLKDNTRTAPDLSSKLQECLQAARDSGSHFLFDLGWREDLESSLVSLTRLNWVASEDPSSGLRATPIGVSHLQDYRSALETVLGVPLEALQAQ